MRKKDKREERSSQALKLWALDFTIEREREWGRQREREVLSGMHNVRACDYLSGPMWRCCGADAAMRNNSE